MSTLNANDEAYGEIFRDDPNGITIALRSDRHDRALVSLDRGHIFYEAEVTTISTGRAGDNIVKLMAPPLGEVLNIYMTPTVMLFIGRPMVEMLLSGEALGDLSEIRIIRLPSP